MSNRTSAFSLLVCPRCNAIGLRPRSGRQMAPRAVATFIPARLLGAVIPLECEICHLQDIAGFLAVVSPEPASEPRDKGEDAI